MSDYTFEVSVLRGQMAQQLSGNSRQFVWVLSEAIAFVNWPEALDRAQISEDAPPRVVVQRLRALADAIEDGQIE